MTFPLKFYSKRKVDRRLKIPVLTLQTFFVAVLVITKYNVTVA